jgi:hypothetical protein
MRSLGLPIGVAALVCLMIVPAIAGQRGNSGNHGPAAAPTHPTHPTTPANTGPKSTGSTKGNGPTSHGPAANSGSTSNHTGNGSSKKTGTTTTTTVTTSTIDFSSTAVGQKLTRNTALQSRLATKLAALGYTGTVFEGAYGFKNLGQFVAATNVSQNLGIPFEQLKLQMTGLKVDAQGNILKANVNPDGSIALVSPANTMNAAATKSLGQSIQTLKPNADATNAAKTATSEADEEIEHETSTQTKTPKGDKKKS